MNGPEQVCRQQLEAEGWTVMHGGWPDFLCIKGETTMLVEVKRWKNDHLTKRQRIVASRLAGLGLEVFRWTKDLGLVPIASVYREDFRPAPKSSFQAPKPFLSADEIQRIVKRLGHLETGVRFYDEAGQLEYPRLATWGDSEENPWQIGG